MHFVFYGKDKENSLDVRLNARPDHIEWLKASPIPLAGPLLNENGDMCGSMVVCKADTLEDAKALFATDPYAKADLFASTEVTEWKWVIGAPENS